jgi:hypothetical protein
MIPQLEDLSIAQRIILTILIVLIVLFCVAAVGFFSGQWEAEGQDIATTKYDAHLIALDKQALEVAYHDQMKLLFNVWLRDSAGTEATRISNGTKIARRAYTQAATQIEQRERALPAR